MLHYRILSYGSDYDWEYMVDLISLRDAGEIERQFVRRLSDMSRDDAFADDASAALMKDIDRAERTGEYAVITPKGKGCITCPTPQISRCLNGWQWRGSIRWCSQIMSAISR